MTEHQSTPAEIVAGLSPDTREALRRGGAATPTQAWEMMQRGLLDDDGEYGWRPPHRMTKLGEQAQEAARGKRT